MIKKYSLYVLTLAFVLTCTINYSFAQNSENSEQIYKVSFEPIDQQEVKPLIAMLMPLFNQFPYIEQGKYESFYYKVSTKVEREEVINLLEGSNFVFLDLSVMENKLYEKMINQNVNPKN